MSLGPDAAIAGPSPTEREALAAAYLADTVQVVRRRLALAVVVFGVGAAIGVLAERVAHPERVGSLLLVDVVQAATLLGGVLALRFVRRGRRALDLAALVTGAVMLELSAHYALGGMSAERFAMGQVCYLCGAVVLLPWGLRRQLLMMGAATGGFLLAAPRLTPPDEVLFSFVAFLVAGGATVAGASLLERYRFEAFVNTALAREAAEVAGALVRVGSRLSESLGRDDLPAIVVQEIIEHVGTDAGLLFMWNAREGAYRLRVAVGVEQPEIRRELEELPFPAEALPLVAALRPGGLLEISSAGGAGLVPADLMARWRVASMLVASVARGDHVIGAVLATRREATGPFAFRQRRMALGIAQAAALALENARLIADLETASRLKSEFVSTMSHELRTPLSVMLGYAEMIRDDSVPDALRAGYAARIEEAGRDLLELIEGTLEIGRMEVGRDTLRLAPVALAGLWRDLGVACARMPRGPVVVLEWGPAPADVLLLTDPRKVTLVVRNLVGNALKFTERGIVRAAVRVERDAVVIEVADSGIGIRPENRDVVFEMFRQGDGSDVRRYGGTGLGLYIVRRCVAQLGGQVVFDSEPGRGTTFTVRLPLGGRAASTSDAA